ncbi:cupin domain-containing protein [Brevibacillus centrosporus]|jgi:quercetin dioxygenase-like cupin family protein|uniref:cupin domain-containing protein n=1 Tax=Brevibacillus centrosporus TaxID=54910 RepID=UPI003808A53E
MKMKAVQTAALKGFSMGEITLRPFAGDNMMVVRVEAPKGAVAPGHAHPHEQISMIISGSVRFRIGNEERVLGPGELVHIPSQAEHEAEMLEDALFLDIFQPVREDFLRKVEEE